MYFQGKHKYLIQKNLVLLSRIYFYIISIDVLKIILTEELQIWSVKSCLQIRINSQLNPKSSNTWEHAEN